MTQATHSRKKDPPANGLLGLLSPRDYTRLRPHLEEVDLEYRKSWATSNVSNIVQLPVEVSFMNPCDSF